MANSQYVLRFLYPNITSSQVGFLRYQYQSTSVPFWDENGYCLLFKKTEIANKKEKEQEVGAL